MWELIRQNQRRSMYLMGGLGVFTLFCGAVFGAALDVEHGWLPGLVLAFVVWLFLTVITYFGADSAVLSMSGARKVTHKEFPRLWNVVEEMAIASGLPRPRIYLINDTAPNAFAAGRKPENAVVAVTSGLLQKLSRDELSGVIAHEMGHVRNRDILYMIRASVMVGTVALLCDFFLRYSPFLSGGQGRRRSRGSRESGGGALQLIIFILAIFLAILAPIIARMLYLCISRRREYLADASAVEFTRNPEGLASALEKISGDQEVLEVANRATAPLYIVNPIKAHEARAKGFFGTHPPIRERIAILRALASGATLDDYERAFRRMAKGGKKGLFSAPARRQAAAERGQRPVPKAHPDGRTPVWPGAQPNAAPAAPAAQGAPSGSAARPFGFDGLKQGAPAPAGTTRLSPERMPKTLEQLEPVARVLTAGAVARGQLPPQAALMALFGGGGLGGLGGLGGAGGAGTLMMACACGQRIPMPDQAGNVTCPKCKKELPVTQETIDAIQEAKRQAGAAGLAVKPGSQPEGAPEEPAKEAAPPHHASEIKVEEEDGKRHFAFEDASAEKNAPDPATDDEGKKTSAVSGTGTGSASEAEKRTPPDPGTEDGRKALIPERLTCTCGFDKPIPPNFKGSRIKCPQCGRMHVFYLVGGK